MIDLLIHMQNFLMLLQSSGSSSPITSVYDLLQEGGLLMGALLVIYGQHRFYRYMIDTLETKHRSQVDWLESELERVSEAFRERSRQDTDMIKDLTRDRRGS